MPNLVDYQTLHRKDLEAFNKRDLQTFFKRFHPDCVFPDLVARGLAPILEGYKEYIEVVLVAFPDWQVEIEETVMEGERVMSLNRGSGTHTGNLVGIPPTGKKVSIISFDYTRFQEDKIVEYRMLEDNFGVLDQIGAFQQPG